MTRPPISSVRSSVRSKTNGGSVGLGSAGAGGAAGLAGAEGPTPLARASVVRRLDQLARNPAELRIANLLHPPQKE